MWCSDAGTTLGSSQWRAATSAAVGDHHVQPAGLRHTVRGLQRRQRVEGGLQRIGHGLGVACWLRQIVVQKQGEQVFRVGLALNPQEALVGQPINQGALDAGERTHAAVVRHQQVPVVERMAVELRHLPFGRRPHMRQDAGRHQLGRHVAQVAVVPRRRDRGEHRRLARDVGLVPAQAKAVAVQRLGDLGGLVALLDQRMVGPVEQVVDR